MDSVVDDVRIKLDGVTTKQQEVESAVAAVWRANKLLLAKQESENADVEVPSFPAWVHQAMASLADRSEEELKAAVERAKGSVVSRKRKRDVAEEDEDAPGDEDPPKGNPMTPTSMKGSGFSERFDDSPESLKARLDTPSGTSSSPITKLEMTGDQEHFTPLSVPNDQQSCGTPIHPLIDPMLQRSGDGHPCTVQNAIAYWVNLTLRFLDRFP
jgi:hypothetical protein